MRAKNISDNIGFDGEYYFCLHCGRSGYERIAQATGHLAQCPKKIPGGRRVLRVNESVKEMSGSFVDDEGVEYGFSFRFWPVRGGRLH